MKQFLKSNKLTHQRLSRLKTASVVFILVAISPLVFYSYKYGVFPDEKVWETPLFTYESLYYESVSVMVWVFNGKFIPLYILTIIYFVSKEIWRHAILIPVGMYVFQIISLFNDDMKFKDEPLDLIYIFPVMIITSIIYYQISKRINRFIQLFGIKQEIEDEIQKTKNE